MSLPHFFLDEQIIASYDHATDGCWGVFALELSSEDIKHAKAMRLGVGEHIAVIDAAQDYFECEVVAFSADQGLMVRIAQHLDATPRPSIVLFQGIAKGEKMDLIIRHATEVGVSRFVPLKTERCIVKMDDKKARSRVERWKAIAKSACMQSGRSDRALVDMPYSVRELAQATELLSLLDVLLICWEEAPGTAHLAQALLACKTASPSTTATTAFAGSCKASFPCVGVVVGPEGGLTNSEVDALLTAHNNAHLVSLGSSILRTETAGIVAPALVMYELERNA
ncbi:MAG: RsmE family RNA methyltransferase [Eggerthellaceae bacterium]